MLTPTKLILEEISLFWGGSSIPGYFANAKLDLRQLIGTSSDCAYTQKCNTCGNITFIEGGYLTLAVL